MIATTHIRVSRLTKKILDVIKINKRETYDDVIQRLIPDETKK